MSEHLSANADILPFAQQLNEHQQTQPEGSNLFDRLQNKWTTVAAVGAAIVAVTMAPIIEEQTAHAATSKVAEVGMPFDGKWGSMASGQADEHRIWSGGDFAQDLFANGTEVKLNVNLPNGGTPSFDWMGSWDSCGGAAGKGVRIAVKVDGEKVGEVSYTHLDQAVTSGAITNKMVLGKTRKWDPIPGCWEVSTDAGVHAHFEAKSDSGNSACYYYRPVTSQVASGTPIARLGNTSATHERQACTESAGPAPNSAPSAPTDLAWWQGDTIFTMPGPNFNTSSIESGLAPPDWAGVMDYNKDGLDDIVLYRKSDGTVRVLNKNPHGGWTGDANNPLRGSGFGEAAWAGVGDFDGDGKKDDIAWWTPGGNVHKLTGPNFTTASYTSGIQPPDWADVVDYNNDGRDDIVFYRKGDGTIRVLNNKSSGGWAGHSQNPLRGPGFGEPIWAGVADLDGDGNKNDIAWWAGSGNVHKLDGGKGFKTSSYTGGIQPPEWAGVMDYNHDGRDDVVFYRQGNGTINVLNNKEGGGWVGNSQNPIRGPGIGLPDWAAVARLDFED